MVGLTVKHKEEKTMYSGRCEESSIDRYQRQSNTENVCCEQCKRSTCYEGALIDKEGKGVKNSEYQSRCVECYNGVLDIIWNYHNQEICIKNTASLFWADIFWTCNRKNFPFGFTSINNKSTKS